MTLSKVSIILLYFLITLANFCACWEYFQFLVECEIGFICKFKWNTGQGSGTPKEASARLILLEDDASSSTRLRVLLGCGKPTADSLENKCKKSGIVSNGRTSTSYSTPEVISLGYSAESDKVSSWTTHPTHHPTTLKRLRNFQTT